MKKRTMFISVAAVGVIAVTAVLISPLGTPIVSAVQNIFMGLNTVKDIKYGGKDVQKVIYQGKVVWEREQPSTEVPSVGVMQEITNANCPTKLSRAYDARDNHSYFVQKLANGQCWMLTNLAYAGGGDTTYGDTTDLPAPTTSGYFNGSSTNAVTMKGWTQPGGTMYTIEPAEPSRITGAGGQYGYLYNFCAAMGGRSDACYVYSNPPQPDQGVNAGSGANNNLNICPRGWRLPTGGSSSDFATLGNALSGGNTGDISGLLNTWLVVYGGSYANSLTYQGAQSYYWSSTIGVGSSTRAGHFFIVSIGWQATAGSTKLNGLAVRCIAG